MKIAIGSDHVGYGLKLHIAELLRSRGHEVVDCGTNGDKRTDYPVYGYRVGRAVASGECERGVLVCGTGVGISIAANKVNGVRAAVCSEPYSARLSRQHNDANIIAFGARIICVATAEMIVEEFLTAQYEGGRHQRRLNMIAQIEAGGKPDAETGN